MPYWLTSQLVGPAFFAATGKKRANDLALSFHTLRRIVQFASEQFGEISRARQRPLL